MDANCGSIATWTSEDVAHIPDGESTSVDEFMKNVLATSDDTLLTGGVNDGMPPRLQRLYHDVPEPTDRLKAVQHSMANAHGVASVEDRQLQQRQPVIHDAAVTPSERDLLAASIESWGPDQMTHHFSDMTISLATYKSGDSFDHKIDQALKGDYVGKVTSGLAYPNLVSTEGHVKSSSFMKTVPTNPNERRLPYPAVSGQHGANKGESLVEDSFDALVSMIDTSLYEVTEQTTSLVAYPNLIGSQSAMGLMPPPPSMGVSYTGSPMRNEVFAPQESASFMSLDTISVTTGTVYSTSLPQAPMSSNRVFTDKDILVYRPDVMAQATQYHVGNQMYYRQLKQRHEEYVRSLSDVDKSDMRLEMMKQLHQLGYRFLKQTDNDQWCPMSDNEIEHDMCHHLSQKCYVNEIRSDRDVLMGRGGHNTTSPGNQRFLNKKDEMRVAYLSEGTDAETKRQISQELVDWVYATGGRFVDEHDNRWYIVGNEAARRKAMQALREKRKRATKK